MPTILRIYRDFTENRRSNYSDYDLNKVISIVEASGNDSYLPSSNFEVLLNNTRRFYWDIENIPIDKTELIYEIIKDINSFLNIEDKHYLLTMNGNSNQHSGLSYHYILPYILDYKSMKKCVLLFKEQYDKYSDYIDSNVYNIGRLFRLPNQGKPTGKGICKEDFHKIIHGSILDSIIQNVKDLPILIPPKEIENIKLKSTSKDFSSTWGVKEIIEESSEKIYQKIIEQNDKMKTENDKLIKDLTSKVNELTKLVEILTKK